MIGTVYYRIADRTMWTDATLSAKAVCLGVSPSIMLFDSFVSSTLYSVGLTHWCHKPIIKRAAKRSMCPKHKTTDGLRESNIVSRFYLGKLRWTLISISILEIVLSYLPPVQVANPLDEVHKASICRVSSEQMSQHNM